MAWLVKKFAATLAVAGCLGVASRATAQELPAGFLESQLNERGQRCEKHAQHRDQNRLLVACGPAGVWELAISESGPRFVQSYVFAGESVGFFTEPTGKLWVKLQVLEARPFASGGSPGTVRFPDATPAVPAGRPAPTATTAPSPPPAQSPATSPAPRRPGRVLSAAPGEVVISLGTADGILRSDRIELSLPHPEEPDGGDAALSHEALAIGVVTNVAAHSSRVQLGLNERVPVGALATSSRSHATASLTAPPRVTGLWSLELSARPFVALGELGGGGLLSGSLGRRFLGHFHVRAVVDPLAFADVEVRDSVSAASAALIASYDSQFFEMGLGIGAQTVNEPGFVQEPGSGLAVAQLIRLGALDGLNVSARTSIVLFHSQFTFGGMVASGQIPVTRGYWLLLGGGGGSVGYGYGEFGLRVMLSGNGHAGSKFLTVTAGGAAVFRSGTCDQFFNCTDSVSYGGPMAGIGGEWRF